MVEPNEGASGNEPTQPPVTEPVAEPVAEPLPPTAKVEVVDGKVKVDGKSYVAESDLIAAKKSLEKAAETAQQTHNTAIDAANLKVSEGQQELAAANAKLQTAEQARESGVTSSEEVTRLKQETETAKSGMELATAKALELKKENLVLASAGTVTLEQLKDKTEIQLDALSEALKVIASTGGPGRYATGSGSGDGGVMTNTERAAALLAATPYRGVREVAPAK